MESQAGSDGTREQATDEVSRYIVENFLGGVEFTAEELSEADHMLKADIARTARCRSAAS